MPAEPPRAVIYVPDGARVWRWQRVCTEHAREQGYRVVTVTGDPGAVQLYLDERLADVVIVGRDQHRRRLRITPRVEVISDVR